MVGVTRIFSDFHYGDRGSRLRSLPTIRPLFEGADTIVLNGDTIDTRPSRTPATTVALRAETKEFFATSAPPVTFLTGNHDPDISLQHTLDLADGKVFVTHGDIIFDDLVPWGQDAPEIKRRIDREIAALDPAARDQLDPRLGAYRRVAASISQRHQSERDSLKYLAGFLKDTVWPPLRFATVLNAWRRAPGLAADLARKHRPRARVVVIGHIHNPGFWRRPDGVLVLNTGSFCPPFGGAMADIHPDRVQLRSIEKRNGEYHPGKTLTEFSFNA